MAGRVAPGEAFTRPCWPRWAQRGEGGGGAEGVGAYKNRRKGAGCLFVFAQASTGTSENQGTSGRARSSGDLRKGKERRTSREAGRRARPAKHGPANRRARWCGIQRALSAAPGEEGRKEVGPVCPDLWRRMGVRGPSSSPGGWPFHSPPWRGAPPNRRFRRGGELARKKWKGAGARARETADNQRPDGARARSGDLDCGVEGG